MILENLATAVSSTAGLRMICKHVSSDPHVVPDPLTLDRDTPDARSQTEYTERRRSSSIPLLENLRKTSSSYFPLKRSDEHVHTSRVGTLISKACGAVDDYNIALLDIIVHVQAVYTIALAPPTAVAAVFSQKPDFSLSRDFYTTRDFVAVAVQVQFLRQTRPTKR